MTAPIPPPPKNLLARHRVLAPTAAVHVSPICLGGLNFGNAYKDILGECNKDTAFQILDYFYDQGGNFIDTSVAQMLLPEIMSNANSTLRANMYQAEESETWLGEWMTKTGRRDEMVLATKYSMAYKNESEPTLLRSNFGGNSAKSLHVSVEASLRKLQTSYIDLVPLRTSSHVHTCPSRTNIADPFCPRLALRPLLGHAHLHPRSDAIPQPPSILPQSPLPRYIRHPRMGCRQMQCVRPTVLPSSILGLPGEMVGRRARL